MRSCCIKPFAADLDVLQIAPSEAGVRIRALGRQGGALHTKYNIYLDQVGVAHVPENYEDRLLGVVSRKFPETQLAEHKTLGPECSIYHCLISADGGSVNIGASITGLQKRTTV